MTWEITWGDREEGLLAVEAQTGETPQTLLDKPRLYEWVVPYWDAYWMLDPGRPVYQGSIGRIPLSEMHAYLAIFGIIEIEERYLFIRMMRALDSVYVKLQNEKITRQIEQDRKATKSRRRDER